MCGNSDELLSDRYLRRGLHNLYQLRADKPHLRPGSTACAATISRKRQGSKNICLTKKTGKQIHCGKPPRVTVRMPSKQANYLEAQNVRLRMESPNPKQKLAVDTFCCTLLPSLTHDQLLYPGAVGMHGYQATHRDLDTLVVMLQDVRQQCSLAWIV